jgi:acyl dehydratase
MSAGSAITVLDGETAVRAVVGSDLGITDWFEITPQRLADFVAATGDTDGAFFAISLSNMFLPQIVEVRGFALGVNYGTQTVRLGTPLRAGDRVRGRATLVDVAEVKAGIQTTMLITVETEAGDDREPCVIESLSRWMNPIEPGGTT